MAAVNVHPQIGDFEDLTFLRRQAPHRVWFCISVRVSAIWNMDEAIALLQNVAQHLSSGDQLLLGVDLVKDSECHARGV